MIAFPLPALLPAPLEGVMHGAFCGAVAHYALVDTWITPFWRVTQGVPKLRRLREFLAPFLRAGVPVRAQLMGVDAALLAETAAALLEAGAVGINLNFACPSRQVTGGGAGGGAWRTPERMTEILQLMRRRLPRAELSVKLRGGWDSPDEAACRLPQLIEAGELDWIALHHRTVREQYLPVEADERRRRWAAAVAAAGAMPLWINGDLESGPEAASEAALCGAAGAMIGRAWLRDPWLFRRPEGPELELGRELFFAAACRETPAMRPGQRIELGKWLFHRILSPDALPGTVESE